MLGRVHDRDVALAVQQALTIVPDTLRDLTACEVLIGVDPVFAGVHLYEEDNGYAYKDTAHCVLEYHQHHRPVDRRGTKIVLPANRAYRWGSKVGVMTVVHELGHVLHSRIGHDWVADPITKYAETNHHEAFAEAFAGWLWSPARASRVDERTRALFEQLAA